MGISEITYFQAGWNLKDSLRCEKNGLALCLNSKGTARENQCAMWKHISDGISDLPKEIKLLTVFAKYKALS